MVSNINKIMEINIKLMLIAFITTSIGALVRIYHEMEKYPVKTRKKVLIYICSVAIGYICYELAMNYDKGNWLGIAGIIGGVISIDLINLIIEKLPNLIYKKFSSKIDTNGDNRN